MRHNLLVVTPLLLLASSSLSAQISPTLQNATVAITQPAVDEPVTGTVWLSLRGKADIEQRIAEIYDPSSSEYHKFLTWQALAPDLPTVAQVQAVQAELAKQNLTVTQLDPNNLSISFQGSLGDFQTAFHTTIEDHSLTNGKHVRAFTAAPRLEDAAAGLVGAVTGIGAAPEESAIARLTDPGTGKSIGVEALQQGVTEASSAAPTYCILPPQLVSMTTPGEGLPKGVYAGPIYGASLSGGQLKATGRCAYTPAQFYQQTGLDKIHAAGYTGKGQTIAILEQIGSPTLRSDLIAFDQKYGLSAANLDIKDRTHNPGPSKEVGETTLDVEWAHAVAPDAKIVVVDVNNEDGALQAGLSYILENHLAEVVSISYGATELTATPDGITSWTNVLMLASSLGVSVNVCSHDYGDRVADEQIADVDVPADSPYATGVGGLSIAYMPGTNQLYKTSWGTDMTMIGTDGAPVASPQMIPHGTNKFGSGGGVSTIFPVPPYQASLGGAGRHVPDVSDIADPNTGVYIVITDTTCTTSQCVEVEGGTSLATPIFAGKWALLNQLNGSSLGQAAPFIAQYANTPAVEDIVPHPEIAVIGGTVSSSGIQAFSANTLANPETTQPYVSALWQPAENLENGAIAGDDYVISFGTDSSLAVTPGYDSATGWGQLDISAIFSGLAPSTGLK
jgi:subtilase family serine protease